MFGFLKRQKEPPTGGNKKKSDSQKEEFENFLANGGNPLDRVEAFCRKRKIRSYSSFLHYSMREDPYLCRWVGRPGSDMKDRVRSVNERIEKVKRELSQG